MDGDTLPKTLPWRDLLLTMDDAEHWSVGMRCPCGFGDTIELLVAAEAKPRWDVTIDEAHRPTIHPSVRRQKGCRTHFWIRRRRVHWCK
ncbi:DUF6527 family protein [Rhizobium leguminosarum]|uniref:DUF6527 family protein n=2 Tax=Rhizobium TaxID=379 RepID=UPI001FDFBB41|nr:DUF6527 family protein [Rhizobium leguminosarum]